MGWSTTYRREYTARAQAIPTSRPSNARNRCCDCHVEISQGRMRCYTCVKRHGRERRAAR